MLINPSLSHKNNIIQKDRRLAGDHTELSQVIYNVKHKYASYLRKINWNEVKAGDIRGSVEALNEYVDFSKQVEADYSFFNWRSDYAGSVIPEFLYRVLSKRLSALNVDNYFSTRDSLVEVTLGGNIENPFNVRLKNQDLCLGNTLCPLPGATNNKLFIVPSIVFEVKTNIDINKLSGLEFSAERLKKSFPASKYFLVTETVDFSLKSNYSSGSLDEIYCLRKQVRSQARKNRAPLQADVFQSLFDDVIEIMRSRMIVKGHVYDRLERGILINA